MADSEQVHGGLVPREAPADRPVAAESNKLYIGNLSWYTPSPPFASLLVPASARVCIMHSMHHVSFILYHVLVPWDRSVDAEALKVTFSLHGEVTDAYVATDRETGVRLSLAPWVFFIWRCW